MTTTEDVDPSWEEVMGKDLMTKRIKEGSGGQAEMGTVVTCNLRGFFVKDGNVEAEPFEEWANQSYKIGESDAIPGIEMALRFSRVGDILRVRCGSRFGYGPIGRPEVMIRTSAEVKNEGEVSTAKFTVGAIPADQDLEYELDILSHLCDGEVDPALLKTHHFDESRSLTSDDAEVSEESMREKAYSDHMERLQALTELQQRKEAGNRWFSYGDFTRSARAYSKATQVADRFFNGNANSNTPAQALQGLSSTGREVGGKEGKGSNNIGEAEAALAAAERAKEAQRRTFQKGDEEVVNMFISCLNNLAACQLHLGEHGKVKELCIRVLEVDPANHKALLRAAKAALATHEYEECDVCLQRLAEVAPIGSSAAVAAATERRRLKQAQQEYRQQQRKMADNMSKQLIKKDNGINVNNNSNGGKTSDNTSSSSSGSDKDKVTLVNEATTAATTITTQPTTTSTPIPVPIPAAVAAKAGTVASSSSTTNSSKGKDEAKDATPDSTTTASASTAAATASLPSTAVKTEAAVATKAASVSADWGLLLLLLTSLAVLLVSIFLVVYTNKR